MTIKHCKTHGDFIDEIDGPDCPNCRGDDNFLKPSSAKYFNTDDERRFLDDADSVSLTAGLRFSNRQIFLQIHTDGKSLKPRFEMQFPHDVTCDEVKAIVRKLNA